jgi:hypothetical protein
MERALIAMLRQFLDVVTSPICLIIGTINMMLTDLQDWGPDLLSITDDPV